MVNVWKRQVELIQDEYIRSKRTIFPKVMTLDEWLNYDETEEGKRFNAEYDQAHEAFWAMVLAKISEGDKDDSRTIPSNDLGPEAGKGNVGADAS